VIRSTCSRVMELRRLEQVPDGAQDSRSLRGMQRGTAVYARADSRRPAWFSAWRGYASAVSNRRHDPRFVVQVVLGLLFAGAMAAFAHVVEDYLTGDPIVRWDVEFSRWLHQHSSPALVSVFNVVTLAGTVVVLAAVTAAVALYLLRRRRLNEAALLCAAALGIEVVNSILKLVFHRPRPELAYVHLDTYSFPSGHAAGSAAIYGIVFYLLARSMATRGRALCAVAYVLLVGVIAFSRLYLEAHYLSDVLAGLSLGFAWACAWLFAYERRRDVAGRLVPRRLGPSTR
jgi:membrane-associated phospholipid phosphatase